ncbi:uncharacterized protein Pyn_31190 [Prunus yedoensis var. nudiflora]|uniref:Uncharacterized protein n=1 Tax=Prunus yedoensis var. nudiflora TaxID=2094558 RepID=A0A314YUH6_PRUYE|nr:uncharacterized protein Pyn_31190 [Prunus yedoensis var. nudiflora]
MEIPIDFFQFINDQYFDSDDSSDMVKGAHVCFYKLSSNYSRNKSLYDHGELIFKRNGKAIDVSFLNIGDGDEQEQIAEQIFHLHARVCDRILIRPWMIAYCKQNKEGTSGWWSLCYDRFDISLSDWQDKVISEELSDPNKVDLKIGFRCLCDYWCRTIRYPKYVKKLLEHPFLMAPSQRMQYIGELHHKLKSTHNELREKLNSDDFLEFFDWNEPIFLIYYL